MAKTGIAKLHPSQASAARNPAMQVVGHESQDPHQDLRDGDEKLTADEALLKSEERFRMLADNMSQLAWTCDLLGNVTWYNKRWLDYTGLAFEEMKGWGWSKVQHPDHLDRVVARVKRSAETGEPWEDTFPLRRNDGQYRWFLSRATPMSDERGNFVQWFGTNTDITDQVLAEEKVARQSHEMQALNERLSETNEQLGQRLVELQAAAAKNEDARRAALNLMEDAVQSREAIETLNGALRESERRFREMIDALPTAVYTTDAEGRITHFNPAAAGLSGRTPELGTDRWCVSSKLYHADGTSIPHSEYPMAIALKEGRAIEGMEAILERPDGTRLWFTPYPTPLRNRDGRVIGGINVLVNITERKQAEQRQRLLTDELAHRGKNLLTLIQAIVSRSLSEKTQALAEIRESLIQRIQALARSQTMLVDGVLDGVSLAEIIRLEFQGFPGRVKSVGPDVMLNARATQTFALLAHELATNATKHGALSQSGGTIAIMWSIEGKGAEARFRFQWQERGGPSVVPPTRQGFGRTLLEKAVAHDFGARPKISYRPEGLSYEIDVPLSAVSVARVAPER